LPGLILVEPEFPDRVVLVQERHMPLADDPGRVAGLLKLPRIPLTVMRPTISALLGSMAFALGPTSPSMRNAESRVAHMA
jgi:hypothetical protein